MAMHVAFPYVDILRYGGTLPDRAGEGFTFCCPDVDVINVFRLTVEEDPRPGGVKNGHSPKNAGPPG